jgi:signal transduction histidine kinase
MTPFSQTIMRHGPARGMYDQIEEALTSITMQLRSAIHADAHMPAAVGGMARVSPDPFRRDSGWARQIAGELGSVLLCTLGLPATIEWHLKQFQKCTRIHCNMTLNVADGFDLPEDCAVTAFDIYGEAMSNVARHAGANRVSIVLTIAPDQLTLSVHDNGSGIGAVASRSQLGGIADMRSRARSHGGICTLEGNAGTTVTLTLPIGQLS